MIRNYSNPSADARYRDLLENLSNFPFLFTYDSKTYHGFSPEFFTHKDTKVTVSDEKDRIVFSCTGDSIVLSV